MTKHKFSEAERFTVFTADGGKCFWCGVPLLYRDVQIDHVFPEDLQERAAELEQVRVNYGLGTDFGLNAFGNWVTCHQGCNLRKTNTILPNSPSTLFIVSQLRRRATDLEIFRVKFVKNTKREHVLAMLSSAMEQGNVEASDIEDLIHELPPIAVANASGKDSTITLSEKWNIVPGSPAASAIARGWTLSGVHGNVAFVNDGRVGGLVPNVERPHSSWQCSQCGSYGPWDGIICRTCGNREEPD